MKICSFTAKKTNKQNSTNSTEAQRYTTNTNGLFSTETHPTDTPLVHGHRSLTKTIPEEIVQGDAKNTCSPALNSWGPNGASSSVKLPLLHPVCSDFAVLFIVVFPTSTEAIKVDSLNSFRKAFVISTPIRDVKKRMLAKPQTRAWKAFNASLISFVFNFSPLMKKIPTTQTVEMWFFEKTTPGAGHDAPRIAAKMSPMGRWCLKQNFFVAFWPLWKRSLRRFEVLFSSSSPIKTVVFGLRHEREGLVVRSFFDFFFLAFMSSEYCTTIQPRNHSSKPCIWHVSVAATVDDVQLHLLLKQDQPDWLAAHHLCQTQRQISCASHY